MSARIANVTLFARDPHRLAEFWSAVMGYPFTGEYRPELEKALRDAGLDDYDLAARSVAWDNDPRHQRFFFTRYLHERKARNHMHLDITPFDDRHATRDELDAERDRLVALGASHEKTVDTRWGPLAEYTIMMRDPEGNEFCLQ